MNGPGVWLAPQQQRHPLRVPAEVTIWSSSGDPRTLWIQTGGVTALRNHLGAVALSWQEARAPRGATNGSYDAKRRRPPTIDRRDECSPCRQRTHAREHDRWGTAQRIDDHPTLATNVGRVVRVEDAPSSRRRVAASAWCLAPRGGRQQHTIGFVFFRSPGTRKIQNPISQGLSPVRRINIAVERERTGWNSIPCLADVGNAKRKIKINVFPVSIHQNTLKYQIKLDKRKIK